MAGQDPYLHRPWLRVGDCCVAHIKVSWQRDPVVEGKPCWVPAGRWQAQSQFPDRLLCPSGPRPGPSSCSVHTIEAWHPTLGEVASQRPASLLPGGHVSSAMKGGLGTPPCPLGSLWEALGTGPLSCRPVCGQRSLQQAGPHRSGPHMSAPSSAHCLSEMWAASESMMSSSSCRLSERSVGSLETCGGGQRPRMQPGEDHGLLGGEEWPAGGPLRLTTPSTHCCGGPGSSPPHPPGSGYRRGECSLQPGWGPDLGELVHDDVQAMPLHVQGLRLVRRLQDLQQRAP